MWFDSWSDLGRVLVVGPAAYVVLVAVLRLSGKRTLAKLNAFDLVITMALGSTLATIFLSTDVSWSEGAVALAALAILQLSVAAATAAFPASRTVVTAEPTLLVREGQFLEDALRGQRITAAEVRQAMRSSGVGDVSDAAAVVLESDGSMSVITVAQRGDLSALQGVTGVGSDDL